MFEIAELPLRNGMIGISPAPGRSGDYFVDFTRVLQWGTELDGELAPLRDIDFVFRSQLSDAHDILTPKARRRVSRRSPDPRAPSPL